MKVDMNIPEFGERVQGTDYFSRPGAYAVILNRQNRIAVMDTPRGCYLPGGGTEGEETPEETLVREVQEECGLQASILRRIGEAVEYVHTAGNESGIRKECTFFAAAIDAFGGAATEPDYVLLWLEAQEVAVRLAYESQ